MTIIELKNQIETGVISQKPLLLKLLDKNSDLISSSYIAKIARIRDLEIESISDIDAFLSANCDNLFGSMIDDNRLYVYKNLTDELIIDPVNFQSAHNLIIVCSKLKPDAWLMDSIVDVPKLEDWMLIDYAYSRLEAVNKSYIDRLLSIIKNPYRVMNEVDKIAIFEPQYQESVLVRLLEADAYSDVSNYDIFALSNAIIKKDVKTIGNLLEQLDRADIDSMALYSVLYNGFRNVILIQLDSTATAQKCGMSDKQFWAVRKFNCGHYSRQQLIEIFKFLTSIDLMIKNGKITTEMLITYMVNTIISIGLKGE